MNKGFVVAIDGPVASGKGTIARLLADKIGAEKIDTGGMYRALALKCVRQQVSFGDKKAVLSLLPQTEISLAMDEEGSLSLVLLDGEQVNDSIRTPEIALGASIVSKYSEVRFFLVKKQKDLIKTLTSEGRSVVIEGRIVATEVVPEAEYKLFLQADLKVRAKRRYTQYLEKGISLSEEDVIQDTLERDERDAEYLPDNPSELGYRVLDTSEMTEEQTVRQIIKDLMERKLI